MRQVSVWLFAAALLTSGATSMAIGARNALRPEQSQDLAPVFKAGRLWLSRANPYEPVSLESWQEETRAADVPDTPPGPDRSTIYSPIAVMDVALVSSVSWMTTKRLWLGLNLALAGYVPWLLRRLWYRRWPAVVTWSAAGLWMGGMGLRIGLGNGQHALLWLALILTACALVPSRPRTAGVVLALSMHKFNLTAVVAPYFLAKRAWRSMAVAVMALAVALIVFLAWSHAPAAGIIASYAREFTWLFGQSRGGTLPGRGVTDLYSMIASLIGDGRTAGAAAFALGAAGLGVTFLATSREERRPRDVDVAAWFLLLLWTTYHRAYDTVLLAVPMAVLIDRAWRADGAWHASRRLALVVALATLWYVDPSKLYLLAHPSALDRIPDSGGLEALEAVYRVGVLTTWVYFVAIALRERGAAVQAIAVQASPTGSDKTTGVVCADGRLLRAAGVAPEGAPA